MFASMQLLTKIVNEAGNERGKHGQRVHVLTSRGLVHEHKQRLHHVHRVEKVVVGVRAVALVNGAAQKKGKTEKFSDRHDDKGAEN